MTYRLLHNGFLHHSDLLGRSSSRLVSSAPAVLWLEDDRRLHHVRTASATRSGDLSAASSGRVRRAVCRWRDARSRNAEDFCTILRRN